VTIIPVITFYAVALALVGNWITSALAHQKLVQRWQEKTQVVLLAEAGLRRAVARYEADREYEGERWQIDAPQMASSFAAEVEIELTSPDQDQPSDEPRQVKITVVARYPAGAAKRVQATKSLLYQSTAPSEVPGESP